MFILTILVLFENVVCAMLKKPFYFVLRHDIFASAVFNPLEHCLVEAHFHTRHVEHLHFISFTSEETVDLHILCLTDSMAVTYE